MRENLMLMVVSLLAILLGSFHLTDDIVRGFEPGGLTNITGILLLVVWLYGALVLAGRPSGYVITLLLSLLGSAVPIIHMRGAGMVGGRIAHSSGMFFWVWTLMALGVTAMLSFILAVRGLWSLQRGNRSRTS